MVAHKIRLTYEMAGEAPIRLRGWALLLDARRFSASLCVMEICVIDRAKAYS